MDPSELDRLVESALPAVRGIVAVAVRSLDASPVPLTLPQYRLLVALAESGPTRAAALAGVLGVEGSTVTRMCDRLLRDGLIVRRAERSDRRAVRVGLSAVGQEAVDSVRARRRREFADLLQAVPTDRRALVVTALQEIDAASRACAATQRTPSTLSWIA